MVGVVLFSSALARVKCSAQMCGFCKYILHFELSFDATVLLGK